MRRDRTLFCPYKIIRFFASLRMTRPYPFLSHRERVWGERMGIRNNILIVQDMYPEHKIRWIYIHHYLSSQHKYAG